MNNLKNIKDISLIEALLILALLSISIYPLAHIISLSKPIKLHTDDQYLATLLAHHVMETIIAKRAKDPSFLPKMSKAEPIVFTPAFSEPLCEYFKYFKEFNGPITETSDSQLYWALNKYKCKVDTYFLDENIFKVIVYIIYENNGKEMKIFFERLLPQSDLSLSNDENNGEASF